MVLSLYTGYLAETLCGGSSRKLIAGWWYSILGMTLLLTIMGIFVIGSRAFSEGLAALWSGLLLCALSVGGTMIMRKFHSSLAVGFFMGSVVAMSQMFFMLFLIYLGYHHDGAFHNGQPVSGAQEAWLSFFALTESVLLATFAAILAAHRSEILEHPTAGGTNTGSVLGGGPEAGEVETVGTYEGM